MQAKTSICAEGKSPWLKESTTFVIAFGALLFAFSLISRNFRVDGHRSYDLCLQLAAIESLTELF